MKKVLLVLALFGMLSAVNPAYAADVDGVWLISSSERPIEGLAMLKADGGALLITWCIWDGGNMDAWLAFLGPFDGTNSQLSLILTSQANGNLPQSAALNFTLTSATTATITLTSCVNFPQQDNCPPVGTVLQLQEIF